MQKPNKPKFESESSSLLNLLDSLYEGGLPKVESEEEALAQMTPGQESKVAPPMDKMPAGPLDSMPPTFPKEKQPMNEEEEELDEFGRPMGERATPPNNIAGRY